MIEIQIPNFNLKQIADSGQCFRMKELDKDSHRYFVIAKDKWLELSQVRDVIFMRCSESEYYDTWKWYFDIDTSYSDIIDQASDDHYLKKCIEYGSGIRILRQDPFEATISFIISQQKSIPCIQKCIDAFCERFGHRTISNVVAYTFPSLDDIADIQLSDLDGLSLGYRDKYIIDAIRWFKENRNKYSYELSDYDHSMQYLKEIKGVGDKVANCICLFGLHQLNACPIDVHMQRIIDHEYQGVKPDWMSSKYAGVYQQYCFYYKRTVG